MTAEQTRVDAADRFKLIISARLTCVVRTFWHLAISRLWLKAFASKCCACLWTASMRYTGKTAYLFRTCPL